MASNDRSRRVLQALRAMRGKSPSMEDEPEAPEEAPPAPDMDPAEVVPGEPSAEVNGIYSGPEDSETVRKLRKVKTRKSIDDDLNTLWPSLK